MFLQVSVCPRGGGEGRAWDMTRYGDPVNERAVRILMECILVHIVVKTWEDKYKSGAALLYFINR